MKKHGMLKVRVRALKFSPSVIRNIKPKQRSRVESAIHSTWTAKEKPEHVRLMEIERSCLRAEITSITIRSLHSKTCNTSVLIADKLRKIELLTKKLNERKLHSPL